MHPILFEFGPVKLYSYGLMVALAFIVATLLTKLEAQRQSLPAEKIFNLVLVLVISGVLGARILYIIQNLQFYIEHPGQIMMLHKGGLSFYGGFILAIICAAIFLKKTDLLVFKTLDLLAPYLALAQSIGRIGCLLNGCCYGKPTDLNFCIRFPGEAVSRHPTQIYSSLSLLLLFIILRILQTKGRERCSLPGQIFLLYCLFYSGLRFFMEYLRADSSLSWANLTIHQLISGVIFIVSGVFLLCRVRIYSASRPTSKIEA